MAESVSTPEKTTSEKRSEASQALRAIEMACSRLRVGLLPLAPGALWRRFSEDLFEKTARLEALLAELDD